MFDIGRNWPVYFFLGLAVFFFVFIGMKSHLVEKEKKAKKDLSKNP